MFAFQRNSTPAGKNLLTACAATAASIMLLSGCGETEEPTPVEPAQVEPAQVESERTADGPTPNDPCELPPDAKPNVLC